MSGREDQEGGSDHHRNDASDPEQWQTEGFRDRTRREADSHTQRNAETDDDHGVVRRTR